MKKEFLFNLVLLVAVNAVVKPVYIFGIDRGVQNLVGTKAYGVYSSLFAFTFLLQNVNGPYACLKIKTGFLAAFAACNLAPHEFHELTVHFPMPGIQRRD